MLYVVVLMMLIRVFAVSRRSIRGRPESTYALRLGGWVRSRTYTVVQGGWVGIVQSVRMMPCSINRNLGS